MRAKAQQNAVRLKAFFAAVHESVYGTKQACGRVRIDVRLEG